MKFLCILAVCALASAADDAPAKIGFTKSFPGSSPAYVSITLDRTGAVVYNETTDEDNAENLQLEDFATREIFVLAQKLDYFTRPVESGLKVAFMGAKSFRWESGNQKNEVKFNYSVDENAADLWDRFERIAESERAFMELKRAVRHDKLGVMDALNATVDLWDRRRLVGETQLLPLLDRIAGDEVYMHIARQRAAELSEAIRAALKLPSA